MKSMIILAVLAATLALTATATAAPLKTIGSGKSSGDFAIASASGHKRTSTIYLRGYGRGLSGMAVVACSKGFSIGSKSTTLGSMASGRLYKLRMPFAGDCDVTASLSGSGSIRLQILAA